ncbi:MAG: hypothetical protein P0Y64_02105 [Candidatus Sphingomonas colombiensis]|nr:hypothetical protein [Sphingomonas sp.]WEK43649.1 MAG: hypothetical protein P0Y64_02105 [Sphingomonas sp.]
MSDRPSLAALDAPNVDWARLQPLTGAAKPVDPPSLWSQFSTSARAAAGTDEIQEARRQKAIDDGYATIVGELQQRGLANGSYSWRLPLPGAQPFYNEDAIWQGIAEARRRDPSAFADAGADAAAFRNRRAAPVDAADADRRRTIQQSGWVPWLAGGFVGGMADPLNQAAMLVGAGGARSIAQAALRDAGINLRIEAVQAPSRAIERAGRGVETTPGDVATELAMAAGTGALFGAGLKAAEPVAERLMSTSSRLAQAMREHIGWERMTDAEQAATRSLEREGEIIASSPFRPGADTERYAAQVDALVQAAKKDAPSSLDQIVPLDAPARARPVSTAEGAARMAADPWQQFKGALRRAESSGDDAARNTRSSATGRYQVIDGTWLRVARDLPEAKGRSDASLLQMRDHPVWQEKVMDRLGVEYSGALSRIGAPETPGNLYLMHFAGTGGASKILRAAGDTPIEELLSKAAIEANPFLRGKSADDVIGWAHARVGGSRDGAPVLRRDIFPDDEGGDRAWREAQREVEAADRDWADWQREDGPPRRAGDFGDDDIPFALDDPRGRAPRDLADGPFAAISPIDDPLPPRAAEAPVRPSVSEAEARDLESRGLGPAASLSFAPKGESGYSIHIEDGHWVNAIYRDADGKPRGVVRAPISDEAREISNEVTSYVAPELRRQGVASRLYDMLDTAGHRIDDLSGTGDLTPDGAAFVNARRSARRSANSSPVNDANGIPRTGNEPPVGNATPDMEAYWAQSAARGDRLEPLFAVRDSAGGDPIWWTPSRQKAERLAREQGDGFAVDRIDPPDGIPPAARAEMLAAFDDPAGAGATHQIDSLEHDLRMFLAEDDAAGLTVRLNEEGDVISAADALHDLDQDEAAIAAARACMMPAATAQMGE